MANRPRYYSLEKGALFLIVLLAAISFGLAQTGTSRINGTVTDASGAIVPGVTVTAKNEATGITYTQLTTDAGLFAFPDLPAGSYTITAELAGFKTIKKTNNVLEVNTPLTVNLLLEVGEMSQVVNVEGGYEKLQTTNAVIGNVVEQKAIQELPLNGRNPLTLITLEPGVVQRSAGGAGSGVHVNGSRDRAYNVTIDGIEANENSVPNPVSNLYRLNPDNVREYKVTTNNATPEEGRNSGASVSVATRGGTNELHGTVYEFARNTAFNSNEFFANAQGTPKPEIRLHQYGFEVGGPIKKNKTFFFGSWQGQNVKFNQPIDQTFGVPIIYTPLALSGVYRYFVADPKSPFVLNGQTITRNTPLLVDRNTGALVAGVRTCASAADTNCVASYNMFANDPAKIGIDPVIAKLFNSYPKPNSYAFGDGLNTATYLWNPPTRNAGPHYMARIDHTFSEKHSLFVRWLQADQDTLDGDPLNGRPQVFPGFPPLGEVFRRTKNLSISYRSVFSSRVVNEFTTGFARFVFLFTQGEANPAFPNIPPFTFNNADRPFINTPRTFRAATTPQFLDNLSIVQGAHVFRMGANIRLYEHNDVRGQPGGINVTPSLSFSSGIRPPVGFNTPAVATSSAAGINSTDNTRLLGSINDLMGIPARLSQVFLGDVNGDFFLPFTSNNSVTLWSEGHRLKQYNFYFQDEWRLRQGLTLNYGVRWEINTAPTEAAGRVFVADKPIDGSQGLVTFKKADRWYDRTNSAIGPRLGIAWSPGKSTKTVIRAGYGLAFDPLSSFQVTAVAGRVPGLVTSCSSTVGGATTPGCQAAPDIRIAQGFPSELPPPATKPSAFFTPPAQLLSNAPSFASFDPDLKLPTVHQWNLSVQRELPFGFVAQVAYVGRRGLRLLRAYDINQINADGILPSFSIMQQNVAKACRPDGTGCPSGVSGAAVPIVTSGVLTAAFVNSSTTISDLTLNAAGNFAGRVEQTTLAAKLRPNQQFGVITYLDSGGDSYYHSGQLTLRKRFEHGLLIGLAYTYAKSIDDQSVDPVGASSGGGLSTTNSRTPTDIRNWRGERGLSDFNRTHALTINSVWELPLGRGARFGSNLNPVVNAVVGGWSLNSIFTKMSGEFFAVRSGVRTSNFSHESRADLVGAKPEPQLQELAGIPGPVLFKDNSAFKIPDPGKNGIGRNIFEAPGYWNLDLGIGKKFDITERVKLNFRTEMFNALNHPNFDNPRDASVGSPSFRSTVFAQTCCATVAPPTTQTIIQTGESARVIQLALKLTF
ncbi:MAG TPA: TonB-dependent receptor [Acidobacteriota bacterium]|nr:TonB-dependent receptor [Acidobacteriota bacterium]